MERLNQQMTEQEKRQLVYKEMKKEIERIDTLQAIDSEERENHDDYRSPLSIDTEIVKKILLSWGGGSDGFKLVFSQEKELLRGYYFMADWGQYEEIDLSEEEAEKVYDFYMYGSFE